MNYTPIESGVVASLPYWMQIFSFIVSLILIILTIIAMIKQLAKRPILKFRLTREIFFRITEQEEATFANGVLIAENNGILIDEVNFMLNKSDKPIKSFPLRVEYFGEKVRGLMSPISEFNFYTSSPISYIPVFMPQRIVYFLAQESYKEEIKKAFGDYKIKIQNEYQEFKNIAPSVDLSEQDNKVKEFIFKIDTIQREYIGKIMELIQIESGRFELKAEILYKTKKFLFFNTKNSSKSKISFKIEPNVKDLLRAQLFSTLQAISHNIIYVASAPIKYPEYLPIEIKEL